MNELIVVLLIAAIIGCIVLVRQRIVTNRKVNLVKSQLEKELKLNKELTDAVEEQRRIKEERLRSLEEMKKLRGALLAEKNKIKSQL